MNTRVTELLGVEHPIIQAPMGYIARAQLASAVSNAGAMGIVETSSGQLDQVRDEVLRMHDLTDKPFGMNIAQLSFDASSTFDSPIISQLSDLNASYTYFPTYAEVLRAYNHAPTIPVFMVESNYEGETTPAKTRAPPRSCVSRSTGRCSPAPRASSATSSC